MTYIFVFDNVVVFKKKEKIYDLMRYQIKDF